MHRFVVFALFGAVPTYSATDPYHPEKNVEEIVVTATALRESPLETAQPVSVLDGEELIRLRSQSLGETVASQPGLSATYFGPQASRPVIRGIGGERVQMYEDGSETLDVSALSGDHSVTIDPLLAERVEIVRGPATLLYGSSASAGLVNVLTHRVPELQADQPLSAALELRGDSALDERAISGRIDGGAASWAWHADAHGRRTGDVRIPGFALSSRLREAYAAAGEPVDQTRGRLNNSGSETYGGALGVSFVGEGSLAGLGISQFDTEYGIPDSAGETAVRIDLRQRRYDARAELRELAGRLTSVRLRARLNDYQHAEIEGSGDIGTLFDQRGLDTRLVFDHAPVAGWRGTFGVQHRSVDLWVSGEEALLPSSATTNTGWFIFEERPFGALTLETGARLERQAVKPDAAVGLPRYGGTAFSGSAGVVWRMTPTHALSANVTSTQRHPTATELYANGPHIAAGRFEIGDPTLARERATTLDLSLKASVGGWKGTFSTFHSEYSRFIHATLTGQFGGEEDELLPIAQFVQADARFTGFELELSPPPVVTRFGTLASRVVADYVRARLAAGGDLPQIPPHRFGLELTLSRGQLQAGLSVTQYGRQERVGTNELPTGSYTLVDAHVGWQLPVEGRHALVFLGGRNLLDEEARRHASPLKDRVPLPGRSVIGGVRLELW